MIKLVLLRHGESVWNKSNKFTGWTDVGLSKKGIEEAKEAGRILKKQGYWFDLAYTSMLKRAIKTLELALKEMNQDIPINYSWRLNERHYGALQGLNKAQTAKKHGEKQVHLWRRSYDVKPPLLDKDDSRWPGKDPLYKEVQKKELPFGECLKDTIKRVLPYWKKEIFPELKKGKKIIIRAHGNSLRALVKYLDNIPNNEIPNLNIPTGIPLIYEFDSSFNPVKHYYLGSKDKIEAAINKVKTQTKSKNI